MAQKKWEFITLTRPTFEASHCLFPEQAMYREPPNCIYLLHLFIGQAYMADGKYIPERHPRLLCSLGLEVANFECREQAPVNALIMSLLSV